MSGVKERSTAQPDGIAVETASNQDVKRSTFDEERSRMTRGGHVKAGNAHDINRAFPANIQVAGDNVQRQ